MYQIKSKSYDFSLRCGSFPICNMAAVRHLQFLKFRDYVTWPLTPCYCASLCKISLKLHNLVLRYGQKRFLKWRPFAILNFENVHIWSSGCHRVPNVQLCGPTKFHQNRMIFRRDMAISWFSRWRTSAILNFRSPIMGDSLKNPRKTSFSMSSIETISLNCLVYEEASKHLYLPDQ